MTNRRASTPLVGVLAVVAAGFLWSCGGSHEGVTAPVAVQGVQDMGEESGGVTSSGSAKITICHKGKDQQIAAPALAGHLRHGDRLGSCKAVSACPCFTPEGLASIAAQCSAVYGQCHDTYSIELTCAPAGGIGTSMGTFEAWVGAATCSTVTLDMMSGDMVPSTLPVTPAQFAACKQAIVGNPYYPWTCPR